MTTLTHKTRGPLEIVLDGRLKSHFQDIQKRLKIANPNDNVDMDALALSLMQAIPLDIEWTPVDTQMVQEYKRRLLSIMPPVVQTIAGNTRELEHEAHSIRSTELRLMAVKELLLEDPEFSRALVKLVRNTWKEPLDETQE